ncbi:4-hydroxy-tetrahydrodipicolinate reductase [Rhodothermus profundi]|uniref:4-hydroxy-tetrahydrodipicolinate reductase n=1 Tax=Rhodothermus profundi TaxID=633813 RepID=A0A1M6V6R5_9BACT|nr:4-hydroxy-tetrahydrodipicolinate reductase [Rhodothermus profundi]SHK77162.1 dihydrodipicolinate reductase [Rhodothermus profundi]
MRLALVGTGNMGQAIERLARQQGDEIVARFNTAHPLPVHADVSVLNGADVVMDFSLPHVVRAHIDAYCRWHVPAVIGTTGWYDQLEEVRRLVEASGTALLYAPNFSLGIALLKHILKQLLPLLEQLPDYDLYVHEVHHTRKADSPSGTALMLAHLIVDGLSRKTRIETETQHGRIASNALHVTSTRAGQVFGRHTIGICGPFDELTLEHHAYSRDGFAAGALQAARWLVGRRGFFSLDDMLHEWLHISSETNPR